MLVNFQSAATLLHVINPAAYQEVKREKIPIVRIKALLAPVMLRRRKQDVLNELPPVTEQIVRIAVPDYVDDGEDEILQELLALGRNLELDGIKPNDWAAAAPAHIKHLALAWSAGTELSKFEVVRAQLGKMKAHASMTLDFAKDALENKGCLVVFTAHHAASDALAAGIRGAGWKVGVADGRTSLPRRVQLVSDFQKSHLDCLVCGMDAMGEGVTLHRADMVVFLEMAYKPSTLHQSRDRLHRIGQTRNVQAVYLLSDHPLDEFLEMMVLGKAELVGKVLSERVHVLGQDRGDVSIASPWPEAMSNGEFVADKPKTAVVSKEHTARRRSCGSPARKQAQMEGCAPRTANRSQPCLGGGTDPALAKTGRRVPCEAARVCEDGARTKGACQRQARRERIA